MRVSKTVLCFLFFVSIVLSTVAQETKDLSSPDGKLIFFL
jgi:hypothetical protein